MALLDNALYIYNNDKARVYNLGTNNNAAGATLTLTLSANVTGGGVPAGSTIVVCVNEAGVAASGTMTDNAAGGANSYAVATGATKANSTSFMSMFYAFNVNALAGGKIITYTKNSSGAKATMTAFAIVGATTTDPLDTAITATQSGTSATPSVTSGTPSDAHGRVLILGIGISNGSAISVTSSPTGWFTSVGATTQNAAEEAMCHYYADDATAYVTSPTLSGTSTGEALILIGFKLAANHLGYSAKTGWAATTTTTCGTLIRQVVPVTQGAATSNRRMFVCIHSLSGTAQTGASEPAFTATRGAKTTDNTNITWQECTGLAGLNGDMTNTPTWTQMRTPGAAVTLGQLIQSGDGTKLLICTTAGNMSSLGSEPTWTAYSTAGATTADNTATWTTLRPSDYTIWSCPFDRFLNANVATWGGVAGQQYFICANHEEFYTGSPNWVAVSGTSAPYTKVSCVALAPSTTPPSASDITTGAIVAQSGPVATFSVTQSASQVMTVDGITFDIAGGDGAGAGAWTMSFVRINWRNCTFKWNSMAGNIAMGLVGGIGWWDNCVVNMSAAGQFINFQSATLRWTNTPSAIAGSSPTNLFLAPTQTGNVFLDGVDLSASTGTIFDVGSPNMIGNNILVARRCKLNASVTPCTAAAAGVTTQMFIADFIDCDSTSTYYLNSRYLQSGTLTTVTNPSRTGGAMNNTQAIGWQIATTAMADMTQPFETPYMAIANNNSGASKTVTVYGVGGTAALPTQQEANIEVDYHGSASTPLATIARSGWTNYLSAATAYSADTSAWDANLPAHQNSHGYNLGDLVGVGTGQVWQCTTAGTSGTGTGPFTGADGSVITDGGAHFTALFRFKMSVTFTPQLVGQFTVKVQIAKASATHYTDPQPVIT